METAQHRTEPLRERVIAVYTPLLNLYEQLAHAVDGEDPERAQWQARFEATRAFLDGRVAGDWTDLARLLVDPATLPAPGSGGDRGPTGTISVSAVPDDETIPDEPPSNRTVPFAPLPQAVDEPRRVSLFKAGTAALPGLLRANPQRTLVLAPTRDAVDALLLELREFTPVRADDAGSADEIRSLRRQLLWLEQWPRDRTTLTSVRADAEQQREAFAAAERQVAEAIEGTRGQIESAGQRAQEARQRHERLGQEHKQAAEEAAQARAAWQELQKVADGAAAIAGERTQAANAAQSRHNELADRATRCEQELQAARERERTLVEELTRAKDVLPEASREVERLSAEAADAAAEGHATYYRLAATESARAAQRRKLSWGQRLHVAPAPPEVGDLRDQVKSRAREADEAAERARRATQTYEEAEVLRAGLAKFLTDGERELVAVREAQQRLGKEIGLITAERDAAYDDFQQRAREAAEAVDRANQAAGAARHAQQVSMAAEEQGNAAHRAQEDASEAAQRAEGDVTAASQRVSALETELAQRQADAKMRIAELEAQAGEVAETEARSREHVAEICGADPAAAGRDLIGAHRTAAMSGIEALSAELESAALVCGTPAEVASGPYARGAGFDALVVVGADRLTDADLLIGAVRASRWVLIADGQGAGPPAEAYGSAAGSLPPEAAERLTTSAYERTITTAPALCAELT